MPSFTASVKSRAATPACLCRTFAFCSLVTSLPLKTRQSVYPAHGRRPADPSNIPTTGSLSPETPTRSLFKCTSGCDSHRKSSHLCGKSRSCLTGGFHSTLPPSPDKAALLRQVAQKATWADPLCHPLNHQIPRMSRSSLKISPLICVDRTPLPPPTSEPPSTSTPEPTSTQPPSTSQPPSTTTHESSSSSSQLPSSSSLESSTTPTSSETPTSSSSSSLTFSPKTTITSPVVLTINGQRTTVRTPRFA